MIYVYLFCGVLSLLLVVEMLFRLTHRDVPLFSFRNFIETKLDILQSRYPAAYDEQLGYIPRPGYSGTGNKWEKLVTILEHGVRSNGREAPLSEASPVLCVGDSFTFGDLVSDSDTWPSFLETAIRQPVLNAGVFGYGIDQIVLRAEQLLPLFHPQTLVLGFIPSDIKRTHYKVRTGVNKPFFQLSGDGELQAMNVPVPPTKPKKEDLGWFRSLFGRSFFVDWCMKHTGHYNWWNLGRWGSELVHRDGVEVSARLLHRIDVHCKEQAISLVVLIQYNKRHILNPDSKDMQLVRSLLEHDAVSALPVLDTFAPMQALTEEYGEQALAKLYDESHMSPDGNRYIAGLLAQHLASLKSKG